MFGFELRLWDRGYNFIAGVDEAGRGPLAGPVVAGAVILDPDFDISGINDSKLLSESQRESLFERIIHHARCWSVEKADSLEIDDINILQATKLAMGRAIGQLEEKPDYVLVDGNQRLTIKYRHQTIVKGDSKSASIAAASIIAKVTRDRIMVNFHKKWPMYNFASHKGYATKEHCRAIARYGPCPIHRKTFSKVKEFVNQ